LLPEAHFRYRVALAQDESRRFRTGQLGDRRQRGIGERKHIARCSNLGFEPNLIGDVPCDVIFVVVHVDFVQNIIAKVEVVRCSPWLLPRNDIHHEDHFVRILPTAEHIKVSVIRRWVARDQWGFAMAGGEDRRTDEQRQYC
jgi:hypothetical protein